MFKALIDGTPAPDTPATRGVVPPVEVGRMSERQRKELENDVVGRCFVRHLFPSKCCQRRLTKVDAADAHYGYEWDGGGDVPGGARGGGRFGGRG